MNSQTPWIIPNLDSSEAKSINSKRSKPIIFDSRPNIKAETEKGYQAGYAEGLLQAQKEFQEKLDVLTGALNSFQKNTIQIDDNVKEITEALVIKIIKQVTGQLILNDHEILQKLLNRSIKIVNEEGSKSECIIEAGSQIYAILSGVNQMNHKLKLNPELRETEITVNSEDKTIMLDIENKINQLLSIEKDGAE